MHLAHTMIRVRNLDRSIKFYTEQLGMKLLRRRDYPSGEFTLAFVGYGPEDSHSVIELTHNWHQDKDYEPGTAWGHLAIHMPDIYEGCKKLSAAGIQITRQPGPMKDSSTEIAFILDPDGYKIELIQVRSISIAPTAAERKLSANP